MILSGFCGKPLEPALVTGACATAALEKQTSMSAVRFTFAMNPPHFRELSAASAANVRTESERSIGGYCRSESQGIQLDSSVQLLTRLSARCRCLWLPKSRTAGLKAPASRGHPLIVAMQSTDILKFDYRAQVGRLNRS
jgi:hypothetical protein